MTWCSMFCYDDAAVSLFQMQLSFGTVSAEVALRRVEIRGRFVDR